MGDSMERLGRLVVAHRITLCAATRIVQTEREEVEVPVWIARRQGEAASDENPLVAVEHLIRRMGLGGRGVKIRPDVTLLRCVEAESA